MTSTGSRRTAMGEMKVPAEALYGPQTQRAVENFPISGAADAAGVRPRARLIKAAAARVNAALGLLEAPRGAAPSSRRRARWPRAGGTREFPIDVFQTGSGTSTNMNANEVIARCASRAPGPHGPSQRPRQLRPEQQRRDPDRAPRRRRCSRSSASCCRRWRTCRTTLDDKARAFDDVIKTGRTHLMDATPIRLGQEFRGYASQVEHGIARVQGDAARPARAGDRRHRGRHRAQHPSRVRAPHGGGARRSSPARRSSRRANHFEAQGAQDARGVGERRAQHAWRPA